MNDPLGNDTGPAGQVPPPPETIDGELNAKAIVYVGIGTVAVTLVSMILVWWLFQGFRKLENAQDPKPSALPEAAEPLIPPSPRLEVSPPANLKELKASEQTALDSPAWIDEAQGTVRLPIDLALDVVARRGLGQAAAVEPAEPAPVEDAPAPTTPPVSAPSPGGGAH